jgi:hypothetical protein
MGPGLCGPPFLFREKGFPKMEREYSKNFKIDDKISKSLRKPIVYSMTS